MKSTMKSLTLYLYLASVFLLLFIGQHANAAEAVNLLETGQEKQNTMGPRIGAAPPASQVLLPSSTVQPPSTAQTPSGEQPSSTEQNMPEESAQNVEGQAPAAANESSAASSAATQEKLSLKPVRVVGIVNANVITNLDLDKRIAFLKVQHREGDLRKIALQELIDEMLEKLEMARQSISVPEDQVVSAYSSFATRNHTDLIHLGNMLESSGVTIEHFKDFLRTQMGWNATVASRYRAEHNGVMLAQQNVMEKIRNAKAAKPTSIEYHLKQVIFVAPHKNQAGYIPSRKRDALAFRARFHGCDNIMQQANAFRDVIVRDLGYVLAPQLPEQWEAHIKGLRAGYVTPPAVSSAGVEAIAVCSARRVSDDRVAQLIYSKKYYSTRAPKEAEALAKKYLQELRKAARIRIIQ